ncbi:MAG: hypothetical protein QOH21_1837 [Acidobacteriota bacterium]|jgi:hypothetical protein|nr:hypothetical protein [Acidobacteriota bacterium]
MVPDLSDPAIPRLVVTGHPNHELAIFGFVQRARPHLLFLTDGGGPERVDESRRALASIGLLERAKFLDWREQTLYEALLARDVAVLLRLVDEVRAELIALAPRQVICESIELYNPLHDITLPIVRAAAAGLRDLEILEFPLIAQEPAVDERYRVQRFPADRTTFDLTLDAAELDAKLRARDCEYASLRRTVGDVANVTRERAATEVFARAAEAFPTPGRDHVLRYEWRARLLQERGDIDQIITFADHFVPVANALGQM